MLTIGMFVANRYEIIEKIGAGGMSDVYKAKDRILGRIVAIKVLKQEFSEDMNFVTKFRTEAQSAAGLEHPNIVNIYDVGSDLGIHYIVMEYVEGVTLKTYIEKKIRLTYKEAVSIAIQVGRGIEAAHAKHIIHRDIKPQNILISTEGKAKVTDFGIARAVSNNTISADVMGSVHYSSPEQARNGFVDGKSDIYSLGIVMYEMVTGRVPFDGDTTVAVAIQHLQEDMVIPSVYAPDLPVSLEKIILKCTQKSPDRRYKSMSELLVDLKQVLISPNEDFVTLNSGANQDKTRVINESEVQAINSARKAPVTQEERKAVHRYEEEPQEEEPEEEGFLNPTLEKAVTIGGIIAAFIIIGIIIYFVGNVLGIFGSKLPDKVKDNTEVVTTETEEPETSSSSVISTEKEETKQVKMIKVIGKSYDEAKAELYALGLGILQNGTQPSDEVAEGLIAAQDVAEGTMVDINTTIRVSLSSGEESISVPSVVGLDNEAAMATLSDRGFYAERTYEYSDTAASGTVIAQEPEGGSAAKKGATVVLKISQGKEAVTVPDVYNQTQEEAVQALTAAGLIVTSTSTEYSDTVEAGKVISQSIASGKFVDKGTDISLVISNGKKTTYYYCKATITAPDNAEVIAADIVLQNANGKKIQDWIGIKIAKFPYTVSVSDIEESSSGTFKIVWYLADGTTKSQEENVTFKKQ